MRNAHPRAGELPRSCRDHSMDNDTSFLVLTWCMCLHHGMDRVNILRVMADEGNGLRRVIYPSSDRVV